MGEQDVKAVVTVGSSLSGTLPVSVAVNDDKSLPEVIQSCTGEESFGLPSTSTAVKPSGRYRIFILLRSHTEQNDDFANMEILMMLL